MNQSNKNYGVLHLIDPKLITHGILSEFSDVCKMNNYDDSCEFFNIITSCDKYSFLNDIVSELVINDYMLLKCIDPFNDIIFKIVSCDGMMLQYINMSVVNFAFNRFNSDHYYRLCRYAVMQNGCAVMHVQKDYLPSNQFYRVNLDAVMQNGLALAHIYKQTEELCLTAVRQNGLALVGVDKTNT